MDIQVQTIRQLLRFSRYGHHEKIIDTIIQINFGRGALGFVNGK